MFWFGVKKVKELETVLLALQNDAANNYKDAAQANFKKFCERLEEYKASGKMSAKQITYYNQQKDNWVVKMRNYTHKDQKTTWTKEDN